MSSSKTKQQVRPEQKVKLINGLGQGLGGISDRTTGLVPLLATAALPDATYMADGILAYDTTASSLKMTKAGVWVAV